jgi:hypothetical protein
VGSNGQSHSLAAEPMPSGAATTGAQFERQEGSLVSNEPRV